MDVLTARLTMSASNTKLSPIPFPTGQAPKVVTPYQPKDATLPEADVLLWDYTAAEGQALAAVFTPGLPLSDWASYTENWAEYEPQLTGRSPAREEKCLAYWAMSQVGDKRVLVLKNNLHLATDSKSLPLRQAWRQIIAEVKPKLVIDTGTAGGIGTDAQVGDTVAAVALKFDLTGEFKDAPFNGQRFATTAELPSDWSQAEALAGANQDRLPAGATVTVRVGDVLTCDRFLFDDARDTYGLRKDDPQARAEEMDAAVLGLVAQDLGSAMPPWACLRSVSDPQENAPTVKVEEQAANQTYLEYGFQAEVATLCACWQAITERS